MLRKKVSVRDTVALVLGVAAFVVAGVWYRAVTDGTGAVKDALDATRNGDDPVKALRQSWASPEPQQAPWWWVGGESGWRSYRMRLSGVA